MTTIDQQPDVYILLTYTPYSDIDHLIGIEYQNWLRYY